MTRELEKEIERLKGATQRIQTPAVSVDELKQRFTDCTASRRDVGLLYQCIAKEFLTLTMLKGEVLRDWFSDGATGGVTLTAVEAAAVLLGTAPDEQLSPDVSLFLSLQTCFKAWPWEGKTAPSEGPPEEPTSKDRYWFGAWVGEQLAWHLVVGPEAVHRRKTIADPHAQALDLREEAARRREEGWPLRDLFPPKPRVARAMQELLEPIRLIKPVVRNRRSVGLPERTIANEAGEVLVTDVFVDRPDMIAEFVLEQTRLADDEPVESLRRGRDLVYPWVSVDI